MFNIRTTKTFEYLEAPCGIIWQQKCFLLYQCHFWYLLIIFLLHVIQGVVKQISVWTWNVWQIAQFECLNAFNCFTVWSCNASIVTERKHSRLDKQDEKKKQRACKILQQQGLHFKSFTSFHQPESDQWRHVHECMVRCIAHK